jgi:dTDP-4-amino-4,6-dideoxygalactose transaminase
VGINSRLDEVQAAVLLVKMKSIDAYNEARRKNAALYTSLLSGHVTCPVEKEGAHHVYHQYTIRSEKRDAIHERLKEAGIASTIYYPVPMHLQPAVEYLGYRRGDLPVSERVAREVLSLPMYPELGEREIEQVADIVTRV